MNYTEPLPDEQECELMSVEEFQINVELSAYTSDDGSGHPVKDGKFDLGFYIYPGDEIPASATHVVWFNK